MRAAKQTSNQRRIEIEETRRRSEQESISAWEGLQTARAQIRSFESGVHAAIGRLTARDLELAVEVYNPETYYKNVRDRWFGLNIPDQQ